MFIPLLITLFLSNHLQIVSSKTFLEHAYDTIKPSQSSSTVTSSPLNTSNSTDPVQTDDDYQDDLSDFLNSDELNSLISLFNDTYFYGAWSNIDDTVIPTFSNTEGYACFHYDSMSGFPLDLRIYDGKYTDRNLMIILSHDLREGAEFDSITKTLTITNSVLTRQIGETYGNLDGPTFCPTNVTAQFLDTTTLKPFDINNTSATLGVKFSFEGNGCATNFTTSIMTTTDQLLESQIIPYISIMSGMAICQCIVLFYFQRTLERRAAIARRTSAWSFVILNAFDLNLFLTISYFLINYSPAYELCSIPCAILAFGYEPKLIWKILQRHRDTPSSHIRSNAEVKTYFCMLALFLCGIASLLVYPDFSYLLCALYLAPQIRLNYILSYKHKWNFWTIGGLGFPKLLSMIYAKIDQNNLFRITPDWRIPAAAISLVLVQLVCLQIQTKHPRFGFEEKPVYLIHNYKEITKSRNDVCAICLDRLKSSFGSNSSPAQSYIGTDTTLQDRRKISTPCQHEFHLFCLKQWLESKLECPYCRKCLPSLPEEYTDD